MKKLLILFALIALSQFSFSQIVKEFKIEKQYLNFPISKSIKRQIVKFVGDIQIVLFFIFFNFIY